MPQLTEEDIQSLYMWIDDIPLTRPKKNMTRDFSDGGAFYLMKKLIYKNFLISKTTVD